MKSKRVILKRNCVYTSKQLLRISKFSFFFFFISPAALLFLLQYYSCTSYHSLVIAFIPYLSLVCGFL